MIDEIDKICPDKISIFLREKTESVNHMFDYMDIFDQDAPEKSSMKNTIVKFYETKQNRTTYHLKMDDHLSNLFQKPLDIY